MLKIVSALAVVLVSHSAVSQTLAAAAEINQPPVSVALVDGPLDYAHPMISAVIAQSEMQNTHVYDFRTEQVRSWWERNQADFQATIGKTTLTPAYRAALSLYNIQQLKAEGTFDSFVKGLSEAEVAQINRIITFANTNNIQPLSPTYLHGTHVAGIMTRGLENVRLFDFQLRDFGVEGSTSGFEVLSRIRMHFKSHFDSMSIAIQKHRILAVNFSVSFEEDSMSGFLNEARKLKGIPRHEQSIVSISSLRAVLIHELNNLIQGNPETIFVFAAGNRSKVLGPESTLFSIKAPNTIVVGAIDHQGALAKFSNTGSEVVDVTARGTFVRAAAGGGLQTKMSGTSMSAPAVVRRLAQIKIANPQFSRAEVMQDFYERQVVANFSVGSAVKGARTLLDKFVTAASRARARMCSQVHFPAWIPATH